MREKEYDNLMTTLKGLSLAEIDYEMRSLMLIPGNISDMIGFFEYVLKKKEDYDLKIVYYYRFLSLLGNSVVQNEEVREKVEKWRRVSELYRYGSEVVERVTLKAQSQ